MNIFLKKTNWRISKRIAKIGIVLFILIFAGLQIGSSDLERTTKQDGGLSIKEYNIKVDNKEKLVFVYFNADWCVPCIKLKPVMEQLEKEEKDKMILLSLDVDENPQISTFFEINTLPHFMLYKKGKSVWTHIGLLSKQELQNQIHLWAERKD